MYRHKQNKNLKTVIYRHHCCDLDQLKKNSMWIKNSKSGASWQFQIVKNEFQSEKRQLHGDIDQSELDQLEWKQLTFQFISIHHEANDKNRKKIFSDWHSFFSVKNSFCEFCSSDFRYQQNKEIRG